MTDHRNIAWAPTAVADAKAILADAVDRRTTHDAILQAVRGLLKRGRVFDVPPELMEIGLTGIRETRAGDVRIFFRATRTRIAIVGVIHALHDPGEALFRRTVRESL